VLVCRTFLRVWAQCPPRSVYKIRTALVRAMVRAQTRSELLFRIRLAAFRSSPVVIAGKRWHLTGRQQTKKSNDPSASYARLQMFKHMLRVDTCGDKVRDIL